MAEQEPFLPLHLYLLLWAACFGVLAYFDRKSQVPVATAWWRYISLRPYRGPERHSQTRGADGGRALAKWALYMHYLQAALTCPAFIVFSQWYGGFLTANEQRKDVQFARLDDPVLRAIGPYDLSMPSTIVVYVVAFGALLVELKNPRNIVIGLQTTMLTMTLRALFLHVTPLAPPRTIIPLVDPVSPYFAMDMPGKDAKPLENDLMFSGHTSSCLATALVYSSPTLRAIALSLTALLAVMVILQHCHYAIDVVVAPFVVFTVWSFVVHRLHAHDWRVAGLKRHGPGWKGDAHPHDCGDRTESAKDVKND